MTDREKIKNERGLLGDLLYKLKSGELCTPNCYGCCGDGELSFAYCPDVLENFEKALYNAGYRKLPEDAVVLTKEEIKHPTRTEVIEFFVNHNAQVRKETVREILDEVSKHFGGRWLVELYKKYGL